MSGKKPAKAMSGQGKQIALDPEIYGHLIKFIGTKGSPCSCAKCGREVIRGMVRILKDSYYCSVTCMKPAAEKLDD